MSCPPVALDAVPAPETMQARMTGWRAAHPRATFAEIEGEATRQVAALRASLIATALAAGEPDAAPACPACEVTMRHVGTRQRTILTSQQEPVAVTGHRSRCSTCGVELFPPR